MEEVDASTVGSETSFPIVCIGASAGGLEAAEEFFKELASEVGMAYVLVQHLNPAHKSLLVELLSRVTPLPVHEVSDRMVVEPDNIYVIPSNYEMEIGNKVLHLSPRNEKGMLIDTFMQSLAEDQGGMAIGVILSGSASDGTIGLKSIKAAGGITFAQDEKTAKYSSMPHSAISAGCVDIVLPPAGIARELGRIAHHPLALQRITAVAKEEMPDEIGEEFGGIVRLLRKHTGNDFSEYKRSTLRRRIQRRLVLHKLERLKDYLRYLQEKPEELDELFQDILINVTGFFRDTEVFDALKEKVFPAIFKERREDEPIRIWVAGCSTGEEAYSVAIILLEYLGDRAEKTPIQIFASDIDAQAIEKARAGIYPDGIRREISPARLQRFFTSVPAGYQVKKSVRDLCLFAVQNVIKDPPFSRMDLVCCRNLLIYLSHSLQKKVLQVLHYSLLPKGYLLLGSAESVAGSADLFSVVDKKTKIYSKKSVASMRQYDFTHTPSNFRIYLPEYNTASTSATQADAVEEAEQVILNEYTPPAVIINQMMEIIHFRGHTGPYIEPAQGSASLNLMKMARAELLVELRTAIRQALKDNARVRRESVKVRFDNEERRVNLQVIPLSSEKKEDRCLLVLFEDTLSYQLSAEPSGPGEPGSEGKKETDNGNQRFSELEHELKTTREYLQTIIEDQERTNEELQSANEEIQSANEELQSTNEELETAKEELQSTNEELITVNEELEGRNTELSRLNSDLNNLLNSVQLPIIMLNEDLVIRHFTSNATQLFSVIHSDVGRSISDIKANIEISDMEETFIRVMDNMTVESLEVHDYDGNWYTLYIRPYKTIDNRIAGVVLVFVAMTSDVERRLAAVVRDSNDAVTLHDFDGKILAWNRQAEKIFGYSESEALGLNIHSLIPESFRLKEAAIDNALRRGKKAEPITTVRKTKTGKDVKVWITSTALVDEQNHPYAVVTTERLLE